MKKVKMDDIKDYGRFAVILRCLLAKKNMTQGELAKAVNMSEATITHYVNGKYTPSQKNLARIAECLGVTPQDFFGDIDLYSHYLNSVETRFATRLSTLMRENNITQEQFSNLIGVSRQTVSNYINGKQLPMTDVMVRIADFFDTTVDSFLNEHEQSKAIGMKVYVNTMPNDKKDCLFSIEKAIYVNDKPSICYMCQFGGDCCLTNKICPRLEVRE